MKTMLLNTMRSDYLWNPSGTNTGSHKKTTLKESSFDERIPPFKTEPENLTTMIAGRNRPNTVRIGEKVDDRDTPWKQPFAPERKQLSSSQLPQSPVRCLPVRSSHSGRTTDHYQINRGHQPSISYPSPVTNTIGPTALFVALLN